MKKIKEKFIRIRIKVLTKFEVFHINYLSPND